MSKVVLSFFVGALTVTLSAGALYAQTIIEGTVELPQRKYLAVPQDRYQDKTQKPIEEPDELTAAVFLEGDFPPPVSVPVVELRQQGYQFRPGLLVIQTGTTVVFPNLDDDYHNILSYSMTKRFDLGRYRKDEPAPRMTFDNPGLVKTYCEIHEHMQGTILVVDTPHFTRTDAEGRYRLDGIPPGNYVLKAWVRNKKVWEKAVIITAGESYEVNFP
ncbi:MAG: carboxypeptidase regulatory-like domain-containing protein [Candidatus Omnitrophota bacterium]|nr:carboxypeptidase regulatory-like domain-containing protein [Candidatus Omnitrophota bacterium]